jgi:glycerophosphoryl diester phosphodiesterase
LFLLSIFSLFHFYNLHLLRYLNPDYSVGFVHEIQNTKEDERSRKFRERKRGHPHGEHPKRASASIRRCFGSE